MRNGGDVGVTLSLDKINGDENRVLRSTVGVGYLVAGDYFGVCGVSVVCEWGVCVCCVCVVCVLCVCVVCVLCVLCVCVCGCWGGIVSIVLVDRAVTNGIQITSTALWRNCLASTPWLDRMAYIGESSYGLRR